MQINFISIVCLLVTFTASAHQATVPKVTIRGCENHLVQELASSLFASADLDIGPLSKLEDLLKRNQINPVHSAQVDKIFAAVTEGKIKSEPLSDMLEFLNLNGFKETTHVCLAQNCVKNAYGPATVALFARLNHQGPLTYTDFGDLPSFDSPEWTEFEEEGQLRGTQYLEHQSPRLVVILPNGELGPNQMFKAVSEVLTFESSLIHELVHAVDTEFIKLWIGANKKLIRLGKKPDALYEKFVRVSPKSGRILLATEFATLFTETRAYEATYQVAKFLKPHLAQSHRLELQIDAWQSVRLHKSTQFDFKKLAAIPDALAHLPTRLLEIAVGPESWGQQMKATIRRSQLN